ncbi:hypothetical protein F2Q68_00035247 [Brassica cretica]|uniref:Uncharacterized protein n=1 Tax=Brassica cretica TaxID=69181 RepID=A0A8S9H9P5_BRACR|nr:hypothetical protein F2Q68_00035247 [Brassica cretica]
MPPPSHSLDHQCVHDVETSRETSFSPRSAATRPHAQEEDSHVNLTRRHLRRTFAGATPTGHRPFTAGKPPPHRRRVSSAGSDFPVSHYRRWPPPATGLRRLARRLAAGVHSYHFSALLRGSETSGLAMLLVRVCGAELFVPWTLLERAGVQRHTVLATLRVVYVHVRAKVPYWELYLLKLVVRLTSMSDCYRTETLEVVAMELKLFWIGPSSPGKAVPEVDSQTQMVEVGGSGQAEVLEFLERIRTAREGEMVSSQWW